MARERFVQELSFEQGFEGRAGTELAERAHGWAGSRALEGFQDGRAPPVCAAWAERSKAPRGLG